MPYLPNPIYFTSSTGYGVPGGTGAPTRITTRPTRRTWRWRTCRCRRRRRRGEHIVRRRQTVRPGHARSASCRRSTARTSSRTTLSDKAGPVLLAIPSAPRMYCRATRCCGRLAGSLDADHPSFTGSNPNFNPVNGPFDVDNDGDGIRESVWIDVGFPVQTAADGRSYKPLAAILCIDLDGRLNVNAHGNIADVDQYAWSRRSTASSAEREQLSWPPGAIAGMADRLRRFRRPTRRRDTDRPRSACSRCSPRRDSEMRRLGAAPMRLTSVHGPVARHGTVKRTRTSTIRHGPGVRTPTLQPELVWCIAEQFPGRPGKTNYADPGWLAFTQYPRHDDPTPRNDARRRRVWLAA